MNIENLAAISENPHIVAMKYGTEKTGTYLQLAFNALILGYNLSSLINMMTMLIIDPMSDKKMTYIPPESAKFV